MSAYRIPYQKYMQFEWLASLKEADKVLSLRYDRHILGLNRRR